MGRIATKGLEYFSMATSWETSVKLLRAKYGALEAVGFLTELWSSIYRENYYRKWDEEAELLFADEIKRPADWVHEVIEYCFSKGIFDRSIYDAKGVLTSHGIQKRYFKIARDSLHRDYLDYIEGVTYPDFMIQNKVQPYTDKVQPYSQNSGNTDVKVVPYADKAKQANSIKDNASKHSISSREDPSLPPAAADLIMIDEIRNAVQRAPFQIRLSTQDIESISVHLNSHALDTGFVAYVIRRAQDRDVKKPGAFARSALLGKGAMASMPEEYRAEHPPRPTQSDRDPPPEVCDECGAEVSHKAGADDAFCSNSACGAIYSWDSFGYWRKSQDRAVAVPDGAGMAEILRRRGDKSGGG